MQVDPKMPETNLLDELSWRGLVHQCTDQDELAKLLESGPQTVYIGFDQPVNVAPHPQAAYGHQGYQTRQSHVNQANVEEGV